MALFAILLICGLFIISPASQASVPEPPKSLIGEVKAIPQFQGAWKNQMKPSLNVPRVLYNREINLNDFENFFQAVKSIEEKKVANEQRENMLKQLSKNKQKHWSKIQERKKYTKWLKHFLETTPCGQQEIQPIWPNFRIIGGKTAIPGSWPWMVSLFFDLLGAHWCAGSLISEQWILTARHCFDFPFNNTQHWLARLGKFDISQDEEPERDVVIKQIIGHPRYNPDNFDNDIALVQLEEPVELNEFIFPICLRSWSTPVTPDCVITGWGKVSENSTHLSDLLKQVHIPLLKEDECMKLYPDKITASMFCAGAFTGGRDTCAGDSGGPLQCSYDNQWYLKGITSWGGLHYTECGRPHQPGVYTRVQQYLGWVYRQIYRNSMDNGDRR